MLRGSKHSRHSADRGFTLVEVVVALSLLSVVALAAGMFFIKALHSSRTLQDQQAATQVSRQLFEQIRAVTPTLQDLPNSSPVQRRSPLVKGRSRADSLAQWDTLAARGVDTSDTYTGSGTTTLDGHAYDPTAAVSGSENVPLTGTTSVSGFDYHYVVAVGTCTRPRPESRCGRTGTGDELFRVTTLITWETGPDHARRELVSSTLVDPSRQPIFNSSRKPYAFDDELDAYAGEPFSLPVLANDQGSWPLNGATVIATSPVHGTATKDTSTNNIMYTPAANYTGDDQLTYRATDTNNVATNYATVRIRVHPNAFDDAQTMTASWNPSPITIPVLTNDKGALGAATLTITSAPGSGAAATVSGQQVSFTAPPAAETRTYQFTYRVTAVGLESRDATVRVTVNPPPPPTAGNTSASGAVGKTSVVDLAAYSGPSGAIYSTTEPGASFTGTALSYTPGAAGTRVVPYTVTDRFGRTASGTVTFTVSGLVVRNVSLNLKTGASATVSSADYLVSGSVQRVDITALPAGGAATVSGTSVIVSRSVAGSGSFTVRAADATGAIATFTIMLTTG